MSAAQIELGDDRVRKTYTDPVRAAREVYAYLTVPWAAPALVDHGPGWLEVERCLPIVALPKPVSVRYRDQLWTLVQRVHDTGWWHGDISLVNVVVHEERGPLLIDWENLAPARSAISYDLFGAIDAGVQPLWPTCGPEGVWWNGPSDECPGAWWAWL